MHVLRKEDRKMVAASLANGPPTDPRSPGQSLDIIVAQHRNRIRGQGFAATLPVVMPWDVMPICNDA